MAITRNTNKQEAKGSKWNFPSPTKAEVTRAGWCSNGSIGFDMVVNDIKISGCFYRTGEKNGKEWEMITLPQTKGANGTWYPVVFFPITNELKESIINQLKSLLGE